MFRLTSPCSTTFIFTVSPFLLSMVLKFSNDTSFRNKQVKTELLPKMFETIDYSVKSPRISSIHHYSSTLMWICLGNHQTTSIICIKKWPTVVQKYYGSKSLTPNKRSLILILAHKLGSLSNYDLLVSLIHFFSKLWAESCF